MNSSIEAYPISKREEHLKCIPPSFYRDLQYSSHYYGKKIEEDQYCFYCGHVSDKYDYMNNRVFVCPNCGTRYE